MNSYYTLKILEYVSDTTKRLEKENILKCYSNNDLLKKVLFLAYNPNIVFYVELKNVKKVGNDKPAIDLSEALDECVDIFSKRVLTGDAAKHRLVELLNSLYHDDAVVLLRVLNKDLKCGISTATINKIFPNLIPEYNFALCERSDKNLVYPCIVQLKMDGTRVKVTAHDDDKEPFIFRTRGGNKILCLSHIEDDLKKFMRPGDILDGELLCFNDDGTPVPRKNNNGIINKAIRGTITQEEAQKINIVAWDFVESNYDLPYKDRFNNLVLNVLENKYKTITHVFSTIVDNKESLMELLYSALNDGHEGIVAKNLSWKYEEKRSFDLVKFKAEDAYPDTSPKTCDLKVISINPGKPGTKYEHTVGSLTCCSDDEKIVVNVSGFTDYVRKEAEGWLNKIIEVKYNSIISSEQRDTYSLYLPRFYRLRLDKTTANLIEEIVS